MKRGLTEGKNDDLQEEYDLGKLLKSGVQGNYAGR
jgi:hypothetical protein